MVGFLTTVFTKGKNMSKIRFYKVNLDYIKYLHNIDNRVQLHEGKPNSYNENRPYIGILLSVNDKNYFAPLEHPRPSHQNIKKNIHIFKIDEGKLGLIGLNNMIPVPNSELIPFDISNDPNKKKLIRQFVYCDNHSEEIKEKAEAVYNKRLTPNSFIEKIYCDFQKLEQAASLYRPPQELDQHNVNIQESEHETEASEQEQSGENITEAPADSGQALEGENTTETSGHTQLPFNDIAKAARQKASLHNATISKDKHNHSQEEL